MIARTGREARAAQSAGGRCGTGRPNAPRSGRRGRSARPATLAGLALLAALVSTPAPGQGLPRDSLRSGFEDLGPATRAMQRDDTANPGMLSVADGEVLWRRAEGAAGLACSDCHGNADTAMRGVAARYPRFDAATGRPLDLSGRIAACRERHQRAPRGDPEGRERLALSAFVGSLSRGLPMTPDPDPRLEPARARGERLFGRRIGQLDLSCADCHDARWGQRLGGSPIPQGHPNGYPLYRLEWQSLGSLQRRLRGCLTGVRAEPWPADAPEWVELELHLQRRGAGLAVETPAVRP
jgi:sulfur-oxidizing protein SoxA